MANLIPFVPKRKPNPVVDSKPQSRLPVDSTPATQSPSVTVPSQSSASSSSVSSPPPNISYPDGTVGYEPPPSSYNGGGRSGGGGGSSTPSDVGGDQLDYSDDVNIERDRVERNNRPPNPPTNTAPTNTPNNNPPIYYSNNPNFKPKDPRGVVVYLNKGKTTGYTNTGIFLPEGVAVSRLGKKDFSNIREEVGKVTREYPDVYTLNQSYDANISLANGGVGYVSSEISNEKTNDIPINPKTNRPYGVIDAVKEPQSRRDRFISRLNEWQRLSRNQGGNQAFKAGIAKPFIGITSLLLRPQNIKNIPSSLYTSGKNFINYLSGKSESPAKNVGNILRNEPDYVVGRAIGEAGLLFATEGTLNVGKNVVTRLSPKYSVVEEVNGVRVIKDVPTATAKVLNRYDLPGARTVDIPLAERIPTMSLPQQVSLGGTTQNLVSGARDLFGRIFKREITVNKPLPKQEFISANTLKQIQRFERGELTASEIGKLNQVIRQETGNKGLLEKSFFADPFGRLRPSRLGITDSNRATALDLISEDITLKKARPQGIFLEKQTISRLPEELADVESSLLLDNPLTESQAERLLQFQLSPSSQFKPVGFISREAEVTLSPGNIIVKRNIPSKTLIQPSGKTGLFRDILFGKRVEIISASVAEPSAELSTLITKSQSKGLTTLETKRLDKLIKSQTGFDVSSSVINGKYANVEPGLVRSSLSNSNNQIIKVNKISEYSPTSSTSKSIQTYSSPKAVEISKPSLSSRSSNKKNNYISSPRGEIYNPSKKIDSPISPYKNIVSKIRYNLEKYRTSPPTPRIATVKVPRYIPRPSYPKLSKEVSSPKLSEAFDVVTYKGGKEVTIARGLPEGLAKKRGVKEVLGTLRASFKLKESQLKTTLPDINYNLPRGFTVSKKDPERFVQVLNTRIKTRPEVFEAKSLKRSSKKIKWF